MSSMVKQHKKLSNLHYLVDKGKVEKPKKKPLNWATRQNRSTVGSLIFRKMIITYYQSKEQIQPISVIWCRT